MQTQSHECMWSIGDARFDAAHVLEHLSCSDTLVYSVQKGSFPVAARDFVIATHVNASISNRLEYITVSVVDSKGPAEGTNGRVRAELQIGSWILERIDQFVHVTYIVAVDIKGTVPSGNHFYFMQF